MSTVLRWKMYTYYDFYSERRRSKPNGDTLFPNTVSKVKLGGGICINDKELSKQSNKNRIDITIFYVAGNIIQYHDHRKLHKGMPTCKEYKQKYLLWNKHKVNLTKSN